MELVSSIPSFLTIDLLDFANIMVTRLLTTWISSSNDNHSRICSRQTVFDFPSTNRSRTSSTTSLSPPPSTRRKIFRTLLGVLDTRLSHQSRTMGIVLLVPVLAIM